MSLRRQRSLLARVVTHIGVAFVAVELVVLAICTGFYWNSLVDARDYHMNGYANAVQTPARLALLSVGEVESPLDEDLDAALEGKQAKGPGKRRSERFIPPTGAPVRVWIFRGREAREFSRDGRLLSSKETAWPPEEWPAAVHAALANQKLVTPTEVTFRRVLRLHPLSETGKPAVLYLESELRDVNEQVATFALVAFFAGGLALIFAATMTMTFLRRSLLLPLSKIIEADNAARQGDDEGALVDVADIPDDEVGAIMRSRNQLFEGMLRAQSDLDDKNAELARQREELRVWGRELERLVQDKTAALLRAREILHSSEKMAALGRLAANVAHEINNPLACIAGYAEEAQGELGEDGDPETVSRSLKTIEEQAFRCKDILKRLLGLARTDELEISVLNVAELVRETTALSEHSMKKRGVELRLELPEQGPTLTSDASSIQQVILNLVENAADAAAVGGGERWVAVSLEANDKEVGLTVRDSGRGIPPEIRERVFDPFYTTKPVGRGTGLGLAICQSLVERLGGRITVESEGGQGAAFQVWLPRERPPAASTSTRRLTPARGTSTADGSNLVEAQLRIAGAAADPDA